MLEKNPKELELAELERLYTEAEQCDKRVFAEQRTNLQLVAGEHWVREGSRYWSRVRDNKQLNDEQRLKLTKNHIQRIIKIYCNTIQSAAPGVAVEPKDEKNLHHQKSAELNYSVVKDWHDRDAFDEKIEEWIKAYFEIGEVACKVFWETEAGHIMGYEPQEEEVGEAVESGEGEEETVDPDTSAFIDEEAAGLMAEDTASEGEDEVESIDEAKPVYSGRIFFETIYGFNLKRDREAPSMSESPYLIYTKMTSLSSIRARTSKEVYDELKKSNTYEYTVFDNNTGTYRNTQDQVLIKEIYFRPNPQLPKGYFYIYTTEKVLAKGELPHGFFPIIYEGCEKQTGNARAHSIIRHIRPNQIELNRCASKVAEHQVTIGDDKVFINSTSKMVQGATLPGIRVNSYTGQVPTILPGRTGDQYLPYMSATIDEMYKLAELEEMIQEVDPQTDIYSLLYRNLRQKRKFILHSDKIERFICKVVELGLRLTKCYISEDALIPAIGKSEYINVAEFKNTDDLSHTIKVKPRTDDVETQMGKQLTINHFLQYAGNNISRQDIGMAMRVSPFLNKEEMFKDFTLEYDNVTNDILALDRGVWRAPKKQDNHEYVVKKLESRQSQEDYNYLPDHVKQMYDQKIQLHEKLIAQKAQQLQAAEAGFIPSGGYLVKMDYYTQQGDDPNKVKRVQLPSESIAWMIDKLQKQGNMMKDFETLPGGAQTDIAGMIKPAPQPQPMSGPGGMAPPMGAGQPPGVMPHATGRNPINPSHNPLGGLHRLAQLFGQHGGGAVPR